MSREELSTDCSRCSGLCCVALPFARSSDFPGDKTAGTPCHNLLGDFGCGIHAELRPRGWVGCTVYDCFGAGQRVTQQTYGGRTWRESPALAREVFEVFPVVRQLHEVLRHLHEAAERAGLTPALRQQVAAQLERTAVAAGGAPADLLALDVGLVRGEVGPVLEQVSAALRVADLSGADLAGALFVTQPQVDSARGDGRTRLPDGLRAPARWLRGR